MTVYKYNQNNICWQQVESLVFEWQCKIYQASFSGNKNRMYFIQNKFIRSTSRKLIAIRRGINNFEKFAKSQYKYFFFHNNSYEVQCSNISLIIDSYIQLLTNLAFEPEWEREFSKKDQNNYRFRVGFQYYDIMENVRKRIRSPTYFTNISIYRDNLFGYVFILEKIHVNPQNYYLFRAWFKRSLLKKDKKHFIKINKITYHVERFFFKNIVMYGMEQTFIEKISKKKYLGIQMSRKKWVRNFVYVRLDNDFIIFSPNRRAKRFRTIRSKWLVKVGFKLRKRRFKICHTRKKVLDKKTTKDIIFPGFTLCGFFFQHCRFKKPIYFNKTLNLRRKKSYNRHLIYEITITPSKKKLKEHLNKLSYIIFTLGTNIHHRTLIKSTNPIIWNWCNYFRYYNCKTRFRLRQYVTFCILKQWSKQFLRKKIFRRSFLNMSKVNNQSETFNYLNIMNVKITRKILLHTDFTPKIFIQMDEKFSIFNEDGTYFNKRFSTIEKLPLFFINEM
jgi:hypothetical protein